MAENGNGNALALAGTVRIDGMGDVFRLADALAKADGFVPRHLSGKPAAIAAVILTGVELGIGPMEAMRGIHVVEGKPTMSAEMMLARARRAGVRTRWLETTDRVARLAVTVPGDAEPQVFAFTWEDAQRAGVAGKDNWKKYPSAMLRARCVSMAIRAACPEVLGAGVYESTSGELTDGEPTETVTARVEPAPQPAALPAPSFEDVEAVVRDALDQLDAGDAAEVAAVRERVRRVWARLSPEQRTALQAARESAEARLAAADAEAAQ